MIRKNEIDASLAKKIRKIKRTTGLTTDEIIDGMLSVSFFAQIYLHHVRKQSGFDPFIDVTELDSKIAKESTKALYASIVGSRKEVMIDVSLNYVLDLYLKRQSKFEKLYSVLSDNKDTKSEFLKLVYNYLMNEGGLDNTEAAVLLDTLIPKEHSVKRINYFKQLGMPIEEVIKYHCEKRKDAYDNGVLLKGVGRRNITYPIVKGILKMDQLLSKEKIVDMTDLEVKEYNAKDEGNKIYACTHIGGNDIQRALQIINVPAYLMLGDPGILYKKLIYQALRFNGVIPLETKDRKDRKIAYNRSIELLNLDGNLLIFPEGAWNVLPNELVMKLFTGTVRMAKETGKPIVPIAMEQIGDTFYIKVGKQYTIDKDCPLSDQELTDELREKLATLKLEFQPMTKRSDIPDGYLKTFQDGIVNKCNYGYGFSLEDALSERFHDKKITEFEEAFGFMDNIELTKDNAFLAKGQQYYKSRKNENTH